jgi:hypothetical protein
MRSPQWRGGLILAREGAAVDAHTEQFVGGLTGLAVVVALAEMDLLNDAESWPDALARAR